MRALVCVLDRKCDGEVVGVEMLWEAITLLRHVNDHICQRIGVLIEIGRLKAVTDECIETGMIVDRAQRAGWGEVVGGDEIIRPNKERALGVIGGQVWVVLGKVGICAAKGAEIFVCDAVGFGD